MSESAVSTHTDPTPQPSMLDDFQPVMLDPLMEAARAAEQDPAARSSARPASTERKEPLTAPINRSLSLLRYDSETSRERYLLMQADCLVRASAVLLAAAGVALAVCFSRSVPGYFEFYISAVLCPALLLVTFVLAVAAARPDPREVLPATGEGAPEVCDAARDLLHKRNDHRSAAIRRVTALLYLSLAVCLIFIIIGIGIGA